MIISLVSSNQPHLLAAGYIYILESYPTVHTPPPPTSSALSGRSQFTQRTRLSRELGNSSSKRWAGGATRTQNNHKQSLESMARPTMHPDNPDRPKRERRESHTGGERVGEYEDSWERERRGVDSRPTPPWLFTWSISMIACRLSFILERGKN